MPYLIKPAASEWWSMWQKKKNERKKQWILWALALCWNSVSWNEFLIRSNVACREVTTMVSKAETWTRKADPYQEHISIPKRNLSPPCWKRSQATNSLATKLMAGPQRNDVISKVVARLGTQMEHPWWRELCVVESRTKLHNYQYSFSI